MKLFNEKMQKSISFYVSFNMQNLFQLTLLFRMT